MAEGNSAHGHSQSRLVLGDVTNWFGKRGLSEKEKGAMDCNLSQKDKVKRGRASSRPCSEINSLKGNVISSISKIPTENKDPNVPEISCGYAVSKSSFDVETHVSKSRGGDCSLNGDNAVMNNPNLLGGDTDFKNLDIGGGDAVFQSVETLDGFDNDSVDSFDKMDSCEDNRMPMTDKQASQNCNDPNMTNLEMISTVESTYLKANTSSKPESLKLPRISKTDDEHNCPSPTDMTEGIVLDANGNGSLNTAMANSKLCNENHDPDVLHVDNGKALLYNIIQDKDELGDGFTAVTSRTVNLDKGKALLYNDIQDKDELGYGFTAVTSRTVNLDKGKALLYNNIQDKDELGDGFTAVTSRTVSETDGNSLYNANYLDADEAKANVECIQSDINGYQNDADDHNLDVMILSQSGSIDRTILPESQESSAFGIEGFFEPRKGDGRVCLNGGTDSIKTCSCSICKKAASIWLDLNYHDIKARVSVTRKSQKEANILAERICRNKATERHRPERLTRVLKLEFDLKHQWRSLFLHMANIWEEEGNQLEASLLPLKDLKEKCRTDSESINAAMPSNNS